MEVFANFLLCDGETAQIPFDAHEENLAPGIDMLIKVKNVAAILENELGNRNHDPFLVRTIDQQYG